MKKVVLILIALMLRSIQYQQTKPIILWSVEQKLNKDNELISTNQPVIKQIMNNFFEFMDEMFMRR